MYCTVTDIIKLLPDSVRVGDNNLGTPSPGTTATKKDQLPESDVIHYIRQAQEEINARLQAFYVTPLRRIKKMEYSILNSLTAGTSVSVSVADSNYFCKGDVVSVQNSDIFEQATISSVTNNFNIVLDRLNNNYLSSDGCLISLLKFPEPIPFITARLAVSIAFDRLYSSDQSPNVSSYGVTQRQLALNDLDGILDGSIKLFGQEMTGRRFIRGTLFDAYKNPVKDFQFGREKPAGN